MIKMDAAITVLLVPLLLGRVVVMVLSLTWFVAGEIGKRVPMAQSAKQELFMS